MLFSCSIAELFCRLNKPVMMCLRVNGQCANCFNLSRNKSDWHFIFIFAAHNRPPLYIVESCVSRFVDMPTVLFSKAKRVAYTRRELLWFISHFINISRNIIFFIFRAQCVRADTIYLLLFRSDSVVISIVPANVFAILAKISVQNMCIARSKSFGSQMWWADEWNNFFEKLYQSLNALFHED